MKRLYEPTAYDTKKPVGSWWEDSVAAPLDFSTLEGEIETEVAIIGAGFAGLNAALQLAEQHDIKATVLEAGQPGWGASGRNGGFCCLGGAKMSVGTQIKRFGLPETQAHMAFQSAAIEQVQENLGRYGLDVDRHSEGELCLAHSPTAFAGLQKDAGFDRDQFGITSEIIPKSALNERGIDGPQFHGGVLTNAGFALNPLKYAQGLARAAASAGATLYGNSPVVHVSKDQGRFLLQTPTGRVRARKLIVATNGYSSEDIPETLAGRFLPLLSSILVTRPITAEEQAAQGWNSDLMAFDSKHLLHYFRLMPDGRFLFGQRGALRATSSGTAGSQAQNRRDFEQMFPAWAGVETSHFWSGLLCLTRNLHQFIGPLSSLDGAFAALGYHGNGVAMASLAGRRVGDLAAGQKPNLPIIVQRPLKRFPFAPARRAYIQAAYVKYRLQDRFS